MNLASSPPLPSIRSTHLSTYLSVCLYVCIQSHIYDNASVVSGSFLNLWKISDSMLHLPLKYHLPSPCSTGLIILFRVTCLFIIGLGKTQIRASFWYLWYWRSNLVCYVYKSSALSTVPAPVSPKSLFTYSFNSLRFAEIENIFRVYPIFSLALFPAFHFWHSLELFLHLWYISLNVSPSRTSKL